MLLLIALVGAGLAYGATTVFFSPSSDRDPALQTEGLVEDLVDNDATPKPEAKKSPKPEAGSDGEAAAAPSSGGSAPAAGSGGGSSGGAAAADDGGGSSVSARTGAFAEDGDDLSAIEEECSEEKNEENRDACEEKLETEADEDAEKAEEEADEEAEEAEEDAQN